MLLHCETVKCIFDLIPTLRKLSRSVRDLIVIHTGSQLTVLRAANLSFSDSGNIAWRGLNGNFYNREHLRDMGMPVKIIDQMFEIIQKVIELKPSQSEMALLGVLCLLSPGSLKHIISSSEQKDIGKVFHNYLFQFFV